MAQLAIQIRDALERGQAKPQVRFSPHADAKERATLESSPSTSQFTESVSASEVTPRTSVKTEPPTRVVDQLHRGDHLTIADAVKAAKPGDRILVRPGFYQEGIVVDKPLEIIGDGQPGDAVVQANGQDALLFKTTMGRVANLTLRQIGEGDWYCVNIAQGRLELEDCDITSQSLPCIAIHGGADPRLRRNRIHDGKHGGVVVYGNGQGTLEDNDIFGNSMCGVGILEEGNPVLRRNRIHDSKQSGVLVYKNGRGTLEDNDIFGNAICGVAIREGGNAVLRRNRINKNVYNGIRVYANGGGVIEDNDLRDNAKGAWSISADSEGKVKRARNTE